MYGPCFKPAPGKTLWIKPLPKCIFPNEDITAGHKDDPNRQAILERFRMLKECFGFTDVGLGMDTRNFVWAEEAGYTPNDLSIMLTPCKISEANGGIYWRKFCELETAGYEDYIKLIEDCLKWWVSSMNSAMKKSGSKVQPFKRIYIDEINSEANYTCDYSCNGKIMSFGTIDITGIRTSKQPIAVDFHMPSDNKPALWMQSKLFCKAVWTAIRNLRDSGNPLFYSTIDGRSVKTEFILGNYDQSPFYGNWINEYAGLSDNMYVTQYTNNVLNSQTTSWWNNNVKNGSWIHLGIDDPKNIGMHLPGMDTTGDTRFGSSWNNLFDIANSRGWDTLGLFSPHDENDNEWATCEDWIDALYRFCSAAADAGWLVPIPAKTGRILTNSMVNSSLHSFTGHSQKYIGYDPFDIPPEAFYPNPFG